MRPDATISQEFAAVDLGNHLFFGGFTWGVTAGVAVIQDKLSQYEAEQLAHVLNHSLTGFREVMGLAEKHHQQVLIDFEAAKKTIPLRQPVNHGDAEALRK